MPDDSAAGEATTTTEASDELQAGLDEIEALRRAGDADGARQRLTTLFEEEAYAALADAELAQARAGYLGLARVSQTLGLGKLHLTAQEDYLAWQEARHGPEHPDVLKAKAQVGVSLFRMGDFAGSQALLETVLAARERTLPADDPGLLEVRGRLAACLHQTGHEPEAIAEWEALIAINETLVSEDDESLLNWRSNLAGARHAQSDFVGALRDFERILAVYERTRPEYDEKRLSIQAMVAGIRTFLGENAGALDLFLHIYEVHAARLTEDHPTVIHDESNLGWIMMQLDMYAESRVHLEHALSVGERTMQADDPLLLKIASNLAAVCRGLGDLARARELSEVVLATQERQFSPDHLRVLAAKKSLAGSLISDHDFVGARNLLEEVLEVYERSLPEDNLERLGAQELLAYTLYDLEDLEGSRALYEDLLQLYRRIFPPGDGRTMSVTSGLASVLCRFGDVEGARDLFEAHLASYEGQLVTGDQNYVRALENVAAVLSILGEDEQAMPLFVRAIDLRNEKFQTFEYDLLRAEQQLAAIRWRLGEHEVALVEMRQVDQAWERLETPDDTTALFTKSSLAQMQAAGGDRVEARESVGLLLEGLSMRAARLRTESPRGARAGAAFGLSILNVALPLEEALQDESEPARNEVLFSLLESFRHVSTSSTEVSQAIARDPMLRGLRDRLGTARAALSDLGGIPPADAASLGAWRAKLLALASERDGYERALREVLESAGVLTPSPTSDAIAARLEQDSAWVSFYSYPRPTGSDPWRDLEPEVESALLAFAITPDGAVRRIKLGSVAPIEEALGEWRASLGRPIAGRGVSLAEPSASQDSAGSGARLRALVLDPVFAQLPKARALYVVLDDMLHLVPLDALPLEEGVVGDRFEIRVEPTAVRILRSQLPLESEPSLVAYGGIDYDAAVGPGTASLVATPPVTLTSERGGTLDALAPLPGTAVEVDTIGALFTEIFELEPTVRRGAAAAKERLHSDVSGARFVHLATHGWFAPESVRSNLDEDSGPDLMSNMQQAQDLQRGFAPEVLCGLALAGANRGADSRGRVPGILTAEELSILDLSGCELAVLSACETNVGPRRAGQGIQSLQGALHAAGARTAITSLWRVDDAATGRLMELFYAGFWDLGLGKARALWRAKTTLRAEGFPTRDWAGWVLTGDPD